jgi:membrane protease YdiL (CAAX protease family)
MSHQVTKNPLIRQGWLRVLLFLVCFGIVSVLLAVPAVLMLLGTDIRQWKGNLAGVLQELQSGQYLWLLVLLECVISLVSVAIFRFWIDRRPFADLGWQTKDFGTEALIGLFMGPALLGLVAVLILLSGHLIWTDIVFDPSTLFISFGLMVLIAFSEELVFRGYILGNLMESFSNKWIALGISALVFALFHGSNPGLHTLAFANLFLAGLLLGINYIYTKNLWFSTLFHLSWNFFQGPILGFRVSGHEFPSLLQAEPKGDLFITGGDFGLEGSILNTAISLISLLILAWAFGKKYDAPVAAGPQLQA